MPDFDPAQFVIGTSAWGSRIPVSRAVSVGAALVDAGFARKDVVQEMTPLIKPTTTDNYAKGPGAWYVFAAWKR